MSGLTSLTHLYLSSNKLTAVSALSGLTSLTHLYLSYNELTAVSALSGLTSLTDLYLSFNELTAVSALSGLTSLTHLDLRSNKLTAVSTLSGLTGLTHLDLRSNKLTAISALSGLTSLTHLYLSYNELTAVSALSGLTSLTDLDLGSNKLTAVSALSGLTSLTHLDLGSNKLTAVSALSGLTSLTHLDLRSNKLTAVSALSGLTSLTHLDLGSNKLTAVSALSGLTSLTHLDLRSNKLTAVSALSGLTGLTHLYLSSNKLTAVSTLSGLTGLTHLYLSSNKLTAISALSGLTSLTDLYLSFNELTAVSALSGLTSLTRLNIENNEITSIPKALVLLSAEITIDKHSYSGISLYNNPIESPPPEIIKQGKQAMLAWYEAREKKQLKQLNEIKIILIGDPKAGKTSLLRRLKEDDFKPDEVQTDGVNIETIDFGNIETFKAQKKLHELTGHFWDFGGQEIMSATHSFFLTRRSVYVLVLDARKDKQVSATIRKEVKRIKATGGDSSIIVVANQIDINSGFGFENEVDLQREFPQLKYFIKSSCKTGYNIELIKEKLEELILKAELLNTKIDERWIEIKEQFQEELPEEHYLDEDRFLKICQEHHLTEEFGQQSALQFLHDLGLVLNFKEVKGYDYYVLNPHWITYGVYQILTSKKAGELYGKIPYTALDYIVNIEEDKERVYQQEGFKRIRYSKSQREFLVQILHQFKLCFILPDKNTFILPDLLATEEPIEITSPIRNDDDCIRFVYAYDFLPRTVLPNLLVETHTWQKAIWRTGCVLQYNDCQGFISQYDNKLSIIVNGDYRKKREFLAVIRSCINKINSGLSDPPEMLIPLPGLKAFVSYKRLLSLERKGRKEYDHYDEKQDKDITFKISELLEGIIHEDEIAKLHKKVDIIMDHTSKIENIEEAIEKLAPQIAVEFSTELEYKLTQLFQLQQLEIDDRFQEMYQKLQQTDDFQLKVKMGIPIIGAIGKALTGIAVEGEFDLKSWAQKMYEKYNVDISQYL